MSTIETNESQVWAAVKRHDEARQRVTEIGAERVAVQNKLSVTPPWEHATRGRLLTELERVDKRLREAKVLRDAAGVERNKAEQLLRQQSFQTLVAGIEHAPPKAPPALPLNEAQVQHLRLLATRVRSDELKLAARIAAAKDFVAIITPLLGASR